MKLLTNSRVKTGRACAKLQFYEYDLGYRAVEDADALRFGTLVHKGLEAWWRAPEDARLGAAFDAIRSAKADPFEYAKARVLLVGYDTRWTAEPFDVLGVEVPFETALRHPETGAPSEEWRLAGKIDAIVRDRRDGLLRLVEHKTSGTDITPGAPYFSQLRLDSQISMYFLGAASLGYEVAACVYDVLGKPQIKPLKATPPESRKYTKAGVLYAAQRESDETPDDYEGRLFEAISAEPDRYYARVEVVRLEDEIREHGYELWQQAALITETQRSGVAPKNADACFRFGRQCSFFPVCCGHARLDDPTKFKRLANVHRELAEVGNAGGS